MGKRGAALMAAAQFRLIEMDAVRVQRSPADETVMRVDVQIVTPFRIELPDPGDLADRLSEIWLCMKTSGCSRQSAPAIVSCSRVLLPA